MKHLILFLLIVPAQAFAQLEVQNKPIDLQTTRIQRYDFNTGASSVIIFHTFRHLNLDSTSNETYKWIGPFASRLKEDLSMDPIALKHHKTFRNLGIAYIAGTIVSATLGSIYGYNAFTHQEYFTPRQIALLVPAVAIGIPVSFIPSINSKKINQAVDAYNGTFE